MQFGQNTSTLINLQVTYQSRAILNPVERSHGCWEPELIKVIDQSNTFR